MKYCSNSLLGLILCFSVCSCDYVSSLNTSIQEDALVSIGNHQLYESEVPDFSAFPKAQQSSLQQKFIENWKKEAVLAYYAEQELSSDPIVQSRIQAITGKLYANEYLQAYLNANAVTSVSDEAIQIEFNQNLESYLPVSKRFKLRYIITDPEVPKNKNLLKLLQSDDADDYYALDKFAIKSSFNFDIEGGEWRSLFDLADVLPKQFFKRKSYNVGKAFLIEQDGFHAYIIIDDLEGDTDTPSLESVQSEIKERILQQENQTIINNFYQSLLKKAKTEGVIIEQSNK